MLLLSQEFVPMESDPANKSHGTVSDNTSFESLFGSLPLPVVNQEPVEHVHNWYEITQWTTWRRTKKGPVPVQIHRNRCRECPAWRDDTWSKGVKVKEGKVKFPAAKWWGPESWGPEPPDESRERVLD